MDEDIIRSIAREEVIKANNQQVDDREERLLVALESIAESLSKIMAMKEEKKEKKAKK